VSEDSIMACGWYMRISEMSVAQGKATRSLVHGYTLPTLSLLIWGICLKDNRSPSLKHVFSLPYRACKARLDRERNKCTLLRMKLLFNSQLVIVITTGVYNFGMLNVIKTPRWTSSRVARRMVKVLHRPHSSPITLVSHPKIVFRNNYISCEIK